MLETFSYPMLFIISFLSSTLIPLASEAFVLTFIQFGFNSYLVLFVASLGNTLGTLSTYGLAYFGKEKILQKYFPNSLKKLTNFNTNFTKFGSLFAFLTFLPFIGDIFALALGFAKYPFIKCAFFVALGKTGRYVLILFLAKLF
ncbi:DedA family protein [Campylobacter sp. MIT 21-1685]|uniref:YqaA family protein n=1 Tax=unclassified Campylobacter TaxID=2593542 RepID=UPI00224A5EBE|nr:MULTISPECIES: YqaA family protein [unclassified Campylobacter]MCX2683795.1 DedA family protein [Campylobacter sp. MIT 21-1684]MCX2752079.1 DedA family protein [Campylobacter sp. MIT 21-1682]MCX2808278.1 DedA family protein [Campylobacter sp. MIT 21-1685]